MIGAIQNREARILAAEAERAKTIPEAQAEAARLLREAETRRSAMISETAATAAKFTNQLAAYTASPSVFSTRTYLETLARAVAPAKKVVLVSTNTQNMLTLNLQRDIRDSLLANPNRIVVPGSSTNKPAGR